ncbi:MAG: type V CRISPR-associated protein Cas12a/Cpf1, partial [Tannerella sp.]|nr:type V CRISPR-associated protein Cas12a/Cpf1 [Tannerella sp.]
MNEFANLYQLSKTLRFELKPVGETLDYIQRSGILEHDNHRAESYKLVKKIIDEYHKDFIERSLLGVNNKELVELLKQHEPLYRKKDKTDADKNALKDVQTKLRKEIVKAFDTKRLFGKELIKEDLLAFDYVKQNAENTDLVLEFKDFTTYFTGFHENRKNMYSDEDKSTAIAYRLIHDNLPKFISNITVFEKIKEPLADKLSELYKTFEEYLNVREIAEIFKLGYYSEVLTQTQIDVYNLLIGGKTLEDGTKLKGLNEYINLYNQQQKDKNARLPKFTPLFKQILSDRDAISWLPETFRDDNDVLETIEKVFNELPFNEIQALIGKINDYDLEKVFLRNDTGLTDISQKYLGHWSEITKAIETQLKSEHPKGTKESEEKYNEKIAKLIKNADSFSIAYLNLCTNKSIEDYFKAFGKTTSTVIADEDPQSPDLLVQIQNNYEAVKSLLNTSYPSDKKLKQDKQNVEKIKTLLDSIKALQWFIKPLLGKGDEPDKDATFYSEFERLWQEL